jgi:hypothetical protein
LNRRRRDVIEDEGRDAAPGPALSMRELLAVKPSETARGGKVCT